MSAIADDVSGTPGTVLESYSYLGLGTIVQKAHPESGVNLTYIQQTGDSQANTTGGDRYTGLDRFGRVIDQNWLNTNTGTAANRYQYGYDRNGNVLYRADLVNTALSELYHANSSSSGDNNTAYDALGRLTSFSRGTLSSSGNNGTGLDRITTSTRSQSWQLDALGNWGSLTDSGTTTTRGFNAQNQAMSVTGGTAPTFDQNGNTLTNFNPLTSAGQQNVYDAWNRLVAVKNAGGTTQASYTYDALGRRIVESYPGTSTTTHLYHSALDQVIEERLNGTAASNVSSQYVWSQDYVNALVLRDTYSGGVRTQRLYALQDANYNTTALVDTTGAVQERYVYDPYGTVTILDASATPRTGNTSAYSWRYLFQGGRRDIATGWYQFQNRDLMPNEGRWAERDPLGLASGDSNLYRFTGNSPINTVDPWGLFGWDWGAFWDSLTSGVGNVVTGAKQAAWDTVAVPVDIVGTTFSSTPWTPQSYYGTSTQASMQNGEPFWNYAGPAVANAVTYGGYSYVKGAQKWYDTGNPTEWQQTAGGMLGSSLVPYAGSKILPRSPSCAIPFRSTERIPEFRQPRAPSSRLAEPAAECPEPIQEGSPASVDPAGRRPTLRAKTKKAAASKTSDGDFIDPNTGEAIPKEGPFDYGHPPGQEWWRTRDQARTERWSRKQVIETENAKPFQIKNTSSN